MTVQDVINELNNIKDKSKEVRFINNDTLEDLVIMDTGEDDYEYTVYLEIDY